MEAEAHITRGHGGQKWGLALLGSEARVGRNKEVPTGLGCVGRKCGYLLLGTSVIKGKFSKISEGHEDAETWEWGPNK